MAATQARPPPALTWKPASTVPGALLTTCTLPEPDMLRVWPPPLSPPLRVIRLPAATVASVLTPSWTGAAIWCWPARTLIWALPLPALDDDLAATGGKDRIAGSRVIEVHHAHGAVGGTEVHGAVPGSGSWR